MSIILNNNSAPYLSVQPGMRGILAGIGIVMLYGGVWFVDRTWDEKGSAAYKKAAEAQKGDDAESQEKEVTIPDEDLDAAFPMPIFFILGWVLFGISYLFDPNQGGVHIGDSLETGDIVPSIICMVICFAMSYIASIPMGQSVRYRDGRKKQKLGMMFLMGWILLSIFSGFTGDWKLKNKGLNMAFCFIGAVTIIASMKILWKHRKMGDSWEQEGKPNPNPHVYTPGLPMFAIGWFVFWLGQSTAHQSNKGTFLRLPCGGGNEFFSFDCGMPFFFNVKAILAYTAGCGMVPVVMFMDWAHDEGGEYVGFGTDGKHFGRFLESPIPFLLMWTLLGFTAFIDADGKISYADEPGSWIVFINCIAQGVVAGIWIQTALYKGDMASKKKGSLVFLVLWLSLIINTAFTPDYKHLMGGGISLGCMIVGVVCIVVGQKTVFRDRKRGDYFMQNDKKENPTPVVYSPGEAFFMVGWILVSQAFAMDFH